MSSRPLKINEKKYHGEIHMKNAIVGQSGGPTAAINATLAGVIAGAAKAHETGRIGRLYGMINGVEGLLGGRLTDLSNLFEDAESRELLSHTPAAALGSCRMRLPSDVADPAYDSVFAVLDRYEIGYVFYIGGNDSMDSTAKLTEAAKARGSELKVIGLPKTVDNDLCGTDHTPGYGSAAKYIATVTSEMLCDCAVYTKKAVTVIEIMGRDAGWLTAAAGIPSLNGRGPDLIYLPEVPFSEEKFLFDVRAALEKHPDVVVAASEGIRTAGGNYVGASTQSGVSDAFGHRYLSGTGKTLENMIRTAIGCKVRSVELNLPQRCAGHLLSATDISESLRIGEAAVGCALSGETGRMMTFVRREGDSYACDIASEDVFSAANGIRTVPACFINEEGNGVTEECLRYLEPLIEGEVPVAYKNGIPLHFHLKKERE